ncbi:MAG: cytochrome o ubiquinol oxidase subunit III [Desulfatiglandaceae bacterium]|jgi:cytochrome o ubiquinol oxidase subunit 3
MMTADTSTIDAVATGEFEHPDTIANQAFGFWLYIMSDLVLFAMIFATYAVLGHNYAGGPMGKDLFHLPYLFGETMLLLFSSATCGLALLAMHKDKRGLVMMWLTVTLLLGLGFITMEINEFHHMILDGNGPDRSGFLSAFFTLVGTHGAHVSFGLIWMAVMMGQVITKGLTLPVQSRLLRLSVFWHFLDIVWVGVFTIVYLMGVM